MAAAKFTKTTSKAGATTGRKLTTGSTSAGKKVNVQSKLRGKS